VARQHQNADVGQLFSDQACGIKALRAEGRWHPDVDDHQLRPPLPGSAPAVRWHRPPCRQRRSRTDRAGLPVPPEARRRHRQRPPAAHRSCPPGATTICAEEILASAAQTLICPHPGGRASGPPLPQRCRWSDPGRNRSVSKKPPPGRLPSMRVAPIKTRGEEPGMSDTQKTARSTTTSDKKFDGFTDEEGGAMKERAKELKAAARRGPRGKEADEESAVLAKIAEMQEPDHAMAERIHAVGKASAPTLSARLWYGMPAYAKDGKVLRHFQSAQKFKTRYATLGFSDEANLDDGEHVAVRLRTQGTDRGGGGKSQRAREGSGELSVGSSRKSTMGIGGAGGGDERRTGGMRRNREMRSAAAGAVLLGTTSTSTEESACRAEPPSPQLCSAPAPPPARSSWPPTRLPPASAPERKAPSPDSRKTAHRPPRAADAPRARRNQPGVGSGLRAALNRSIPGSRHSPTASRAPARRSAARCPGGGRCSPHRAGSESSEVACQRRRSPRPRRDR